MKKFLLVLFLAFTTIAGFGQQFSQYNTGSLYESFENPSVRVFIPDSSKMFATNFFIPSFNANFYLAGNAQAALKSRIFNSYYNTADLKVGQGALNHFGFNLNSYDLMFKAFSSFNGNVELGFFISTNAEGRGIATDETLALFNGPGQFPNNSYSNIFNDNYMYQVYQSIGVTYREQINDRFSLGIKVSALSGVTYNKLEISQSQITFDKAADTASLSMSGRYYSSGDEGQSGAQTFIPKFHNPGLAVSIGASVKTDDGFTIQTNLKNVGFIHWNSTSTIVPFYNFGAPTTITGLSTPSREDNIYNNVDALVTANSRQITTDFTSHTNGTFELSANKSYWLGSQENIKFSPTLILSKELFYDGFTGALIAPFQLSKYSVTLTSSYNNYQMLSFGGQFMIKTPNTDFFIGSERLFQSINLLRAGIHSSSDPNQSQYTTPHSGFTGMDYFVGISFKFGSVIEPNMNTSYVPNGDKGFFGRLIEHIFPSKDPLGVN